MGVANALQMIAETVGQCRQVLEDLVRRRGGKEMTLDTFRYAITTIKGVATYDGIYTRSWLGLSHAVMGPPGPRLLRRVQGRSIRTPATRADGWNAAISGPSGSPESRCSDESSAARCLPDAAIEVKVTAFSPHPYPTAARHELPTGGVLPDQGLDPLHGSGLP